MIDLSVIIPNRNSQFLTKTIRDILEKAVTNIEVVINIDENWPDEVVDDPRVHYIHPPTPRGMRWGINTTIKLSQGKYIMKVDDHCMFGEGFDKILIDAHQENWVQIPRRYALDAEKWQREERTDNKYPIDQMYLDFPLKGKEHDWGIHGVPWKRDRKEEIDDTPSLQGSCYFMARDYFQNFLGELSEVGYGQFSQEAQEIGFKTWLGGGRMVVNKKTWYAHLHKGNRYGRMYKMPGGTVEASNWSAYYWMENKWKNRVHDMSWLINEKFPNMPSWPDNWQEVWDKQVKEGWPNIYEEN